ncbi:MAG TPA: CocE/NonD family hydrolase [Baekduia sp.]|nr:CocE/NonD family hydrolase [Baekduia sp.]
MTLLSEIVGRRLRLPAPLTRDVEVQRDLRVPMDDGVELLADRWAPPGSAPAPTVLVRSPYGRRQAFGFLFGRLLSERGLQVVLQSTRGSFGSGGRFDAFREREDGLATLRWLRAQPWHAGRVATLGPSYMGLVQWAIADEVDAMALSVTASSFRGPFVSSGSLPLETALSWLLLLEVQERRSAPVLLVRGLRRTLPRLWSEVPLTEMARAATGADLPIWREWIDSLEPGNPYWENREFSANVGRTTAATQLIGGWQDIFLPWLIEDWTALRDAGRQVQLIVGPGGHVSPSVNGLIVPEGLAWLRAELLGDRRLVRETPVRVYVTGEERWRDLPDWPPPGASELRLHLRPGGGLAPEAPPDPAAEPSRFTYDPADPTPPVGGPALFAQRHVVDNRALEARPDVLTFTTPTLEHDVDALGPVRAAIALRASQPHTDLFVRVCDVHPDGRSLNVCDGFVRLSPDAPARDADGVAQVELPLWPTAHRFAAGHRIRVQVSSGAHPRWARNPGTGEEPARAAHLVASRQEVLHDARHPSAVTLTVAAAAS